LEVSRRALPAAEWGNGPNIGAAANIVAGGQDIATQWLRILGDDDISIPETRLPHRRVDAVIDAQDGSTLAAQQKEGN